MTRDARVAATMHRARATTTTTRARRNAATRASRPEGARKGSQYLDVALDDAAFRRTTKTNDDDDDGEEDERTKPEVLAPCGAMAQVRAAFDAGADCAYVGLDALNARARASNFTSSELADVATYAHERGKKVYVAMNVLVFDEELGMAEDMIRAIARAGADAVIVQDVGLAKMIKRVAPNLPIHGSTQMSITSAEGARFARDLGCKRVVVGRELSVSEIAAVKASCPDVEVEAFVHGALCVSYSGQCFSSEAWGGRSANRGQCAQACRMPYGLVVDGELRELGDVKYLLSPQDLMAVELVPELIDAGVGCFKIEGRLKGPEYVALATAAYRRAVDLAWDAKMNNRKVSRSELLTSEQRVELTQVFARGQDAEHDGLTPGFLEGPMHQRLVRGRAPRHRGVLLGEVTRVQRPGRRSHGSLTIRISNDAASMKRGDGVVIDRGAPEEREEGGRVYEIFDQYGASVGDGQDAAVTNGEYSVTFGQSQIDYDRVEPGHLVWRTSNPTLEAKLAKLVPTGTAETSRSSHRDPCVVVVSGSIGEALVIKIIDDAGRVGEGRTTSALAKSTNNALDVKTLKKAIGELGGTPLAVSSVDVSTLRGVVIDGAAAGDGGLYISPGEIKAARRDAVESLIATRLDSGPNRAEGLAEESVSKALVSDAWWGSIEDTDAFARAERGEKSKTKPAGATLSVLCRSRAQAEAAMGIDWIEEIVLDFLEVHGLQKTVRAVQAAGKLAVVATPRVLKPQEETLWQFYLKLGADALLIRSAGLLQTLIELRAADADVPIPALRGDFSLNAANAIGADLFLKLGLERLTPTHDLNADQQRDLALALGPAGAAKMEIILHQHLPIFHTEHCVFCRFMSDGNSYKDCGHPCETKNLHLRDTQGADHLVLADMGCRNTVFNAQAQTGASYVKRWIASGVKHYRVELVDEPASAVRDLMFTYKSLIDGELSPSEASRIVSTIPDARGLPTSISRGSLEVKIEIPRDSLRPTASASRARARARVPPTSS